MTEADMLLFLINYLKTNVDDIYDTLQEGRQFARPPHPHVGHIRAGIGFFENEYLNVSSKLTEILR